MPCSFGSQYHRRSAVCGQPSSHSRVTVIVRWIPLDTAAYGTWVARPVRRRRSHLAATAPALLLGGGPSSVTTASWPRARRARGSRVGNLNPSPSASPTQVGTVDTI
jgi:hypothetical protein